MYVTHATKEPFENCRSQEEGKTLAIVTQKKFMTGICEGLHSNVRQFDVISGKGKFGRGRQIKQ